MSDSKLITLILFVCILCAIAGFILNEIVGINSNKPITPEIRITIKDNQIDTVYIYRKP